MDVVDRKELIVAVEVFVTFPYNLKVLSNIFSSKGYMLYNVHFPHSKEDHNEFSSFSKYM